MVPTTSEALSASYDPFSPEALENSYPYYAALRSLAPCCYLEKYEVYFVSRYRDVISALKNSQPDRFLIDRTPNEHCRIRLRCPRLSGSSPGTSGVSHRP